VVGLVGDCTCSPRSPCVPVGILHEAVDVRDVSGETCILGGLVEGWTCSPRGPCVPNVRHHPFVVILRILEELRVHEAVGNREEQTLCAMFLKVLNLQYPRFMCPFL
jgi:hypothetical protein